MSDGPDGLEHAAADLEQRDIEGAATKVERVGRPNAPLYPQKSLNINQFEQLLNLGICNSFWAFLFPMLCE